MSKNVSRRKFLEIAAGGAAAVAVSACAMTSTQEPAQDASTLIALFPKVGKADATILSTGNSCVVVDTGTMAKGSAVCKALKELDVTTIDALVITHFDQDHVGGAAEVIDSFAVTKLYTNDFPKESDEVDAYERACKAKGLSATVVRDTTQFALDGVSYTLLPPEHVYDDQDASNNASLVARVEHGGVTMLLAGDIERARIDELLASGVDLSCDLLKVPHHGQAEKNSAAFISAASPRYAIVTSSKDEREDDKVIDALEKVGAEVFLTRKGAVQATSDGASLMVLQG